MGVEIDQYWGDSAKHGQQSAGPNFPTFALAAENNFSFSTANTSVPPMQGIEKRGHHGVDGLSRLSGLGWNGWNPAFADS